VGQSIDGATDPATVAERINADVVFYGVLEPDGELGRLSARIYARPQFGSDVGGVVGNYDLAEGIPSFDATQPNQEVWRELDPLARAAGRLMLGLRQELLGSEEIALTHFERAAELAPELDITHYFVGQGNLYLAQEGGTVEPSYLEAAAAAFARALEVNPQNARAQIGAGSVRYLRAQTLLDASTAEDFTGDSVAAIEGAIAELRLALAAYEPVAAGPEQIETYGLPVASMANYEAGIALRLLGDAYYRIGAVAEAQGAIDEAISRLESAVGPLVEGGNNRQAAQAYQALGTAYEWRGFLLAQNGGEAAASEAYEKAVANYEACAGVGEQYPFDTFMVEQIVRALCLPRIEALNPGGTGGG
jgi:tetratricopeptide (TPR) repeat protein